MNKKTLPVNEATLLRRPGLHRMAIVLIIVLAAAMPFLIAAPALAQSVSISASTGVPGINVTITGTGFTNGDTYLITFAPGTSYEELLAPSTVISGTSFTEIVTVPHAPGGQYNIRVSTNRGNFSLLFTITPVLELNVNSGSVGDILLASGAGFRASRAINVYFNNSIITNTSSNAYGILNPVSFQVPAIRTGNYNVYATDSIVASPIVIFTVRPYLAASLSQGYVGDQIKLDGTGFDDNSGIRIYWDSQLLSSSGIFTNSAGTFTANIVVPPTTRGNHTIQARDNTSGTSTVNFIVNPKIVLNPNLGASGTIIAITGTGFRTNAAINLSFEGTTIVTQPVNVTTNAAGSFTASFTVPSVLAGNYNIRVSDGISTATAVLSVASDIRLNITTGSIGSEVLVTGTGFTPRGRVSLSYDNQALITITTDSGGAFSVSFTVPVSNAGQHNISARDLAMGGITASVIFTVESIPPPVPSLLAPPYNSLTGVQPRFGWSAVGDPSGVSYELQVARDANFTQLVLFKQGLTQTEYQVVQGEALQLTKRTNPYYWRVRAVDGAGNASGWTNPGSFYTQDSTPPGVPTPFSPPNDTQADLRPIFGWSEVSDPSGVTYELQVARDTSFTQLVLSKQGLTSAEYQVGQAEALMLTKRTAPYYWRVRAVDGAANASNWSSFSTFYTEDSTPPPAPVPLQPENGSRKGGKALFTWTAVADPGGVTYTLEVAQDSAFSRLVIYKEGLKEAIYQLTNTEELSPTTGNPQSPYYWRVRAVDQAQNESNWSIINAFYVGGFFQQNGWVVWVIGSIGVLLLILIGIFIGVRLRPSGKGV